MLLDHTPQPNQFFLRHADAASVTVVDTRLTRSVLLSPSQVIADFPASDLDGLDAAAVERIVQLQPEVVLLGTGARTRIPPPATQAAFLRRRIGIEAMDNAAAARTFNVLAGEGRRVVALFLLPG